MKLLLNILFSRSQFFLFHIYFCRYQRIFHIKRMVIEEIKRYESWPFLRGRKILIREIIDIYYG